MICKNWNCKIQASIWQVKKNKMRGRRNHIHIYATLCMWRMQVCERMSKCVKWLKLWENCFFFLMWHRKAFRCSASLKLHLLLNYVKNAHPCGFFYVSFLLKPLPSWMKIHASRNSSLKVTLFIWTFLCFLQYKSSWLSMLTVWDLLL